MADSILDFATRTGQLIKGRSPVGHDHDGRYQLVLPITLGSTDDLDTITTPRRYRCISSAIAGDAALHYPPGATHGFLDVIEMGTGYVEQVWVDTWNGWIALRRLYAGAFSAWVKITSTGTTAHDHNALYVNLDPVTLGSTQDLDTVLTARRYKTISASIASDPALHYPAGAQHGILDVTAMGTGYTAQQWTDIIGGWIASRRYTGGAWTAWTRIGGSGDTDPRVQTLRTTSITGDYRPDRPSEGEVAYWTGPAGVERVDWTYRGHGYVGRLGAATGYTTMQIQKVQADDEIEVSCLNPGTGRHITHRIMGTGYGDDQRRFEEAWVGAYTGTTVSKDTLILPRSNIEWAFQIDVNGNAQFAPHHSSTSAQAIEYAPPVFTDRKGAVLDITGMALNAVVSGLDGLKIRQRMYLTHPDSGATRWCAVDEVKTITPDGMIQSEAVVTFLQATKVQSNYAPMTPVNHSIFDKLHVLGGSTYTVLTTPPAVTEYTTITEGHQVTSALFTSTASSAFVAVAFPDPVGTLMRGHALEDTNTTKMRVEQRSGGGLTKLYPGVFAAGSVIPAGTVWRPTAQWRYGETTNPAQYA